MSNKYGRASGSIVNDSSAAYKSKSLTSKEASDGCYRGDALARRG